MEGLGTLNTVIKVRILDRQPHGKIAQSVEQRLLSLDKGCDRNNVLTENPCVVGSNPTLSTI